MRIKLCITFGYTYINFTKIFEEILSIKIKYIITKKGSLIITLIKKKVQIISYK